MNTATTPITKRERNDQKDIAAASIYRRRFDIEKRREELELARQLREPI